MIHYGKITKNLEELFPNSFSPAKDSLFYIPCIRDERKWELAGEGHRRMDLIRWGILIDVVKSTEYRVYDPEANIQSHHVLLPIPTEEINLNPALLESDPTNNGYR